MVPSLRAPGVLVVSCFIAGGAVSAAEVAVLSDSNWAAFASSGKEADAISGDIVLRNDLFHAVLGAPGPHRHANMNVRRVGGQVIDLARRDAPGGDQLQAFYAVPFQWTLELPALAVDGAPASLSEDGRAVTGRRIVLVFKADPPKTVPDEILPKGAAAIEGPAPAAEVRYTIEDGDPALRVETVYTNRADRPTTIELLDTLRAERTFEKASDGPAGLFWVYDRWFGQAYGVLPEERPVESKSDPIWTFLRYPAAGGKTSVTIPPGGSSSLVRRLFPAENQLQAQAIALACRREKTVRSLLRVRDASGAPVSGANVRVVIGEGRESSGRTRADGTLPIEVPDIVGPRLVVVSDPARGSKTVTLDPATPETAVGLDAAAVVEVKIVDGDGAPIPAKVQFLGRNGTPDPFFGPDTGDFAVQNLCLSADGSVRRDLPPGSYEVIVSHGPEYDALFRTVTAERGKTVRIEAKLPRSVDTTGWISADFHGHSTASGDNTTSTVGRVLNLLAEHVEFAPATEHNRVDTYAPILERLGATARMGTCPGIELTSAPLFANHQNAFPLVHRPRAQNGGGPLADNDPEVQIARLALWDDGAEKLVQQNHPDIGLVFFDRDADGKPDGGFAKMFPYMDAIEVWPIEWILLPPVIRIQERTYNNRIFNWMQLLNRGVRLPGTCNTDAHYAFHGSGFARNYFRSPTDDPAAVKPLDVVRTVKRGHVVMTNGPFLEVRLRAASASPEAWAEPGDEVVAAPGGEVRLRIRVQCANWLDIDRVQVYVNGRPDPALNRTRKANPERFHDGVVKFEEEIPVLLASDAHLIVAALGEHLKVGPVMGPDHGANPPAAVANPIRVDVDGGGFQPNGDALDSPLPVAQPPAK